LRRFTHHYRAIVAISTALTIIVALSGCSSLQSMMPEPRPWGACAIAGGIIGTGAGAASGVVIATEPRSSTTDDTRIAGGLIGAAIGAGVGTVVGHYLCDPIPAPPAPPVVAQVPPPPPPPPPPPAKEKLVLRGINFDFDKYNIKPEFEPVLDEAVSTLQAKPNVRINVNGHTDNVGTVEYNIGLSNRRANSVVNYLTSKGIASDRLVPQGFGLSQPIATNSTAEGRAQNRRVELVPIE